MSVVRWHGGQSPAASSHPEDRGTLEKGGGSPVHWLGSLKLDSSQHPNESEEKENVIMAS